MAKTTTPVQPQKPEALGENTVLTVAISNAVHQRAYAKVLSSYVQKLTLPGFRQGKAPQKLVEDTVGEQRLIQEALERVFPEAYDKAVKDAKIFPLVHPHVEAEEALHKDKDWMITAHTAVAPIVTLGDWKKIVKEAGQTLPKPDHEHKEGEVHDHSGEALSHVFSKLIESVKPKIAPLLLEHETKRQLESFAKELAGYKIDLDSYLARTHKTIEQIQQEMMASSLGTLQVEFVIQAIAEDISPVVPENEVKQLVGKSLDKASDAARERLLEDARAMVRRRKVIEEIKTLAGITK